MSVSQKSDNSRLDPVSIAEGTEQYVSGPFSTAGRDLSALRASVTVTRTIQAWEGLIGWHSATYTATPYRGISIKQDLITDLEVSKGEFDPYAGEDVEITYNLLRPAAVTISITGANGSRSAIFWNPDPKILSYSPSKPQSPGSKMETWSGILDFGEMDGYYDGTGAGVFLATGGGYMITVHGEASDGSGITDSESESVIVRTTW